ncbi:tetratricopeptide repeat protein [Crocosphaera sp. XPORK-15E]|uniref:tetratricopeptide repeat protein n=1 Tax=Crocosphaera sp. XPORK-15E TaxID=3110247 RepID=UPI002B20A8A5|nr:tetratricopeptide repeat protein [Crocosphaera sp. XPORK-15E]MEA5536212.1 tetratricopeptide repeat protein [Crocosphaera sp. XPORK-15E]
MQGLLKRIWQWIKQFLGQFFASSPLASGRYQNGETSAKLPLTDTDYEFLFSQLLDGVAHGWHEGRILKYFEDLGERGKAKLWVDWLERFGQKALASSAPNLQLAARMMRLGELAQSFQAIEPIGQTAYEIGRKLYTRESDSTVWEYEGPDHFVTDIMETQITPPSLGNGLPPVMPSQSSTEEPEVETLTLTLEELATRLDQDQEFAAQLAQQFGLDSTQPQAIIDAIIRQSETQQSPENSQENSENSQENPESLEFWLEQAEQQLKLGDLEGAIASWEKVLEIDPNFIQAWHNRASALGELGQFEEAIASFDRVIALNPQEFQSLNGKGLVLYNMGQFEEAIVCFERVIEGQPSYYQAWYNRASALEQLGRVEEAIAYYRKTVEIQPDFEPAQTRLKELELSPE